MSERFVWKTNTLYKSVFRVVDGSNAPVTGISNGSFTKYLYKDGASDATTVTVTEIANGNYYASFTPGSDAYWSMIITHATYGGAGWQDDIQTYTSRDAGGRCGNSSINDASATTTGFVTSLTDTVDIWSGLLLVLTSGTYAGTARWIKSYNTSTKAVTVDTLPGAPANGTTFDIFLVASPDHIARRAMVKLLSDVESEMGSNYRCLAGALATLINKKAISAGTLSIKKTDDTTELFNATLTTDATQQPITVIDPN